MHQMQKKKLLVAYIQKTSRALEEKNPESKLLIFFFFLKSIKATPSASRADMRAGTIL